VHVGAAAPDAAVEAVVLAMVGYLDKAANKYFVSVNSLCQLVRLLE
jgi:hypothetical protein